MTKIEECAIEYIHRVNQAAGLRTQMRNLKCKEEDMPMTPEDGPGVQACWRGDPDILGEWCETCLKGKELHEQRKYVVKRRTGALARLKRAVKKG